MFQSPRVPMALAITLVVVTIATVTAIQRRHQVAPPHQALPPVGAYLFSDARDPMEFAQRRQMDRLLALQAATPAPRPRQSPRVNYPAGSVQDVITKAFSPYGSDAVAWGLRVARCESGFNPRAYNPAGPYYGLFQFLMSTFRATPYGSGDIYDPVANANAAAWKYAHGGAGAWGCH